LAQLRSFNGLGGQPIYVCVLGRVYNLSAKPQFYGPGGAYAAFAGHDASRCLAKMSLSADDLDKNITDLTKEELTTLHEWRDRYEKSYPVVGLCEDITGQAKV